MTVKRFPLTDLVFSLICHLCADNTAKGLGGKKKTKRNRSDGEIIRVLRSDSPSFFSMDRNAATSCSSFFWLTSAAWWVRETWERCRWAREAARVGMKRHGAPRSQKMLRTAVPTRSLCMSLFTTTCSESVSSPSDMPCSSSSSSSLPCSWEQ